METDVVKYCTGCGVELEYMKEKVRLNPNIKSCCPDSRFIDLTEIKRINPRNREEVFFIDLKTGKIYDRDINEAGRAYINVKKKILTIKTTYVERLNFSDVKQGFFKTK